VNNRLLLPVGKLDVYMGGNLIQAFAAVEQDIPTLVVAAMFQKEPQVLMAHPGQGFETLADLKGATLFLSKQTVASSFQWLKAEYGFRDEQVKPYAFSAAPFLADKRSAQQGYATSEPLAIRRQGGFDPKVFLLADYGFDSYATTIETRRDLVTGNPDLVRRFVEASILGWVNYLHGDNAAANALIRKLNPDISEELIAFSIDRMKQDGIVDSGEALTLGVGAMTDARMASFYGKMVKAGVPKPGLDIAKAYSLAFVNKGVGLAEKARLTSAAGKP
jgi:NitT/TauT family transport system substrate-binding protein